MTVRLDSREELNIPPFGGVIDYMTYGGLYREVYLMCRTPATSGTYSRRCSSPTTACAWTAKSTFPLRAISSPAIPARAFIGWTDRWWPSCPGIRENICSITLPSGRQSIPPSICCGRNCPSGTRLWMCGRTESASGRWSSGRTDCISTAKKSSSGAWIATRAIPTWAMPCPNPLQKYDADLLKNELGCNAVRTSHYPQSHHFLDRCDELGLLVLHRDSRLAAHRQQSMAGAGRGEYPGDGNAVFGTIPPFSSGAFASTNLRTTIHCIRRPMPWPIG